MSSLASAFERPAGVPWQGRSACPVLLLTALVATACGDEDAPPLAFRDMRIEELAPTRAVARFETSRPASCMAEYGLNGSLDLIATDPSMAEGELSLDHEVPLEDLIPSSRYSWRARATDAEGHNYASETQSFETPDAPDADTLVNVALAAQGTTISGKSSNWAGAADDGAYGAESAIDGKMATEWSSDGDGDDAWLELDLGQRRQLVALGYRSRMMTDGTSIATSIELVLDDAIRLGPFATPDHTRAYRFDFGDVIAASTARLEVRSSTGGNTGARELQLFEAP